MPQLYPLDFARVEIPAPPTNRVNGHAMAPGKRVALLVNGPSLSRVWDDGKTGNFDVVVAMNTAAWLFPCDYMVATDSPLIKGVTNEGRQRPRKAMVCYPVHQTRLSQMGIPWINIPNVPKVKPFTFPRAILFALELAGNGTVELFGVDWSDTKVDAAGVKGDHGPERWQKEADAVVKVWDRRIVAVHGELAANRLAFFKGETKLWA